MTDSVQLTPKELPQVLMRIVTRPSLLMIAVLFGAMILFRFPHFQSLGFGWALAYLASFLVPVFLFTFRHHTSKALFFFVGSFIFYGSHSYSTHNIVFELLVAQFGLGLLLSQVASPSNLPLNSSLNKALALFGLMALVSLPWIPGAPFFSRFSLWGPQDTFNAMLLSAPGTWEYSVTSVLRVFMYGSWVYLLSQRSDRIQLYKHIGAGLISGAMIAVVIGLLEHQGLYSLGWFTQRYDHVRLQSFFRNPGWFAEYISIATPFILAGFFHPNRTKVTNGALFLGIVLTEISIILTGSRTSWLIYPLILFTCWAVFYWYNRFSHERPNPKTIIKIFGLAAASIPITLIISVFLVEAFFTNQLSSSIPIHRSSDTTESVQRDTEKGEQGRYLGARLSEINTPAQRVMIWKESRWIIGESPFFGLGFESYRYWANSLMKEPQSKYGANTRFNTTWETVHNFYLQLVISLGLVGLLLWLSMNLYLLAGLIRDAIFEKATFNISIVLAILAFHLYGLTQNMSYIGVIWFVYFLMFGYGLTLAPFPEELERRFSWVLKGFFGLVLISALVPWFGFSPADKYQIKDPNFIKHGLSFSGFYGLEPWAGKDARWSGQEATVTFEGDGFLEFSLHSSDPTATKDNPAVTRIFLDGHLLQEVRLINNQPIDLSLPLPGVSSHVLRIENQRTWCPSDHGSTDHRQLGAALVNPRRVKDHFEFQGFYEPEIWNGKEARWSEQTGEIRFSGQGYFMAELHSANPGDQADQPTVAEVYLDGVLALSFGFIGGPDQSLALKVPTPGEHVIKLVNQRIWQPSQFGSADQRKLGIAVVNSRFAKHLIKFTGFYDPESWDGKEARWSTREGVIDFDGAGVLNFDLHPSIPSGQSQGPNRADLYLDGSLLKQFTFTEHKPVSFSTPIENSGAHRLKIVNHTLWKPSILGSPDQRELGVAVVNLSL